MITFPAIPAHRSAESGEKSRFRVSTAILAVFILSAIPRELSANRSPENDTLIVAAVQFEVSPDIYENPASFRQALEDSFEKLQKLPGTGDIDLVVFPEYSSAFLGWAFLSDEQREKLIHNPAGSRPLIIEAVTRARPLLDDIWGNLAEKYDCAILAGTALVARNSSLVNRALLYSDEGELIWHQDKSFAGSPEAAILNLGTGKPEDATPFEIDGKKVVVTICRDTYNDIWEDEFGEADLWIDIKANELPYTEEYYDEALADRLDDSPIDTGLTVSLSGDFLGYTFTGVTEYFVDDEPVAATSALANGAVLVVGITD